MVFQKESQHPSDSHPEDRSDQTSHVDSLPIVYILFILSPMALGQLCNSVRKKHRSGRRPDSETRWTTGWRNTASRHYASDPNFFENLGKSTLSEMAPDSWP